MEEFEMRKGGADYGGMVRPSQHVAPYEKGLSAEGIGLERFENSRSRWTGILLRFSTVIL